MKTIETREQWLTLAATKLADTIIEPALNELKLNLAKPPIRFSTTQPQKRRNGVQVLGACYKRAASSDAHNEIFICATHKDALDVLDTLLHELIHAYTDNEGGHGGLFKRISTFIGLVRVNDKPGTEHASPATRELLELINSELPALPAAPMRTQHAKKQKSRQVRVYCPDAECGFKFHTTRLQIERITDWTCNVCGLHRLTY